MLPAPIHDGSKPYLQPVGAVMRLFGRYQGKMALACTCDNQIDAVASKTGSIVYLHVANTDMRKAQRLSLNIGKTATMHFIAADPRTEITWENTDAFDVKTQKIDPTDFTLPPAAVAAIEIEV